jgi:hypothetical protein
VMLGHGGQVLSDAVLGDDATAEVVRGVERIVAVGQGRKAEVDSQGLSGWHAGLLMPYAGWSTAVAAGAVVRSTCDPLALHRERLDAGWVTGAELARGVTTVTTTFASPPTTIVIVLDDPAAFGNDVAGRTLLLGLDGAVRARDASGQERPPALLAMENRSVLAYDVVPQRNRPVVVTIASETGWSLVGVMGSAALDATGAIALISSRGLDTSIRPLATKSTDAGDESRLRWVGPTRSQEERRVAKMRSQGPQPFERVAKPPAQKRKQRPARKRKQPSAQKRKQSSAHKTQQKRKRPSKGPTGTARTRAAKGRKTKGGAKAKKGGRR